ncbi:MAG: dihydrolipoyl dehydrogenase [Deltaproteobacteria bacterium]|nr:dihydrolipoyl dehydrogenase [Deltaproteobacteria bacterium]
MEIFDVIVIGAGPGGHAMAEQAARDGAKVAIIEKSLWGGTCTHRGCIPTKALLACSKHYADLKKLKRMGINVGPSSFDFTAMKRHQQQMVKISALGVEKSLREAGVNLKSGEGKILSPREIQWTDTDGNHHVLQTQHLVVAWGSEPQWLPDIRPSEHILTSDGFLELQTLPESMIIVGGSVIGVEFATFLAELGVKVTLIEMMEQILPLEDEDASTLLKQELTRLGVTIHTSAKLQRIHETADSVQIVATHQGQDFNLTAAYALICTGRRPRLHVEELNRLGIRHNPKGIFVNEDLMTNIRDIYAIGDVTGGIMLAHRAMQQGKALASTLFGGRAIVYQEEAVPAVIYSHPQVARVGLTEKQARQQGLELEVKKTDFAANIIARTELTGQGFVKSLFHKDHLVGVTIVGEGAADLITPMSLAVANGLGKRELSRWIIPHPSLSEVLTTSS